MTTQALPSCWPGSSIRCRPTPDSAGRRTISHYEILAPLGKGGMGEVYVAFDTTLQRRVALKVVRQDRQLNDEGRARLLREARILSQLDHPGICRVFDYVSADGHDYLVLELIEGRSLREALRRAQELREKNDRSKGKR